MVEFWSLDQALGWVVWRDLSIVWDLRDRGERFGRAIIIPPDQCWFGQRLQMPKLHVGKPQQLLEALKSGQLQASGVMGSTAGRVDITHASWRDLDFSLNADGPVTVVPKNATSRSFISVELSSSAVIKVFKSDGSIARKTKGNGDGEFNDRLLLERMNRLINETGTSVVAAARSVAADAKGHSPEAIIDRLRRKYRKLKSSK